MRLTPIAAAIAIAVATMSSAGHSQRPDDQIDARSISLARDAQAALAAGRFEEANDLYETALVVDPRNRAAFIGLAKIAQAQRLPGKAIRLYSDVLQLEPDDVAALAGQGEAYVQRGAVDRARTNLTKLQEVCDRPCPQAAELSAIIQRGPPVATAERSAPEAKEPRPN